MDTGFVDGLESGKDRTKKLAYKQADPLNSRANSVLFHSSLQHWQC